MRTSIWNTQSRISFPWQTLVATQTAPSSSSQLSRHHGYVDDLSLKLFLLLTFSLVGWSTCCVWQGGGRPGSSKGDWKSRLNKRKARYDHYYYFVWRSGWCGLGDWHSFNDYSWIVQGRFSCFLPYDSTWLLGYRSLYSLISCRMDNRLMRESLINTLFNEELSPIFQS